MEESKFKNIESSGLEELKSLITLLASLDKEIKLYALGGTAMVLAGYKPSTKDIDFLTPLEPKKIKEFFNKILLEEIDPTILCNKWKFNDKRLDIFYSEGGMIMGFPLTDSWKEKSKLINQTRKVRIYILSWEDIISTKLARGEYRDFEDIMSILEKEKIDINEIEKDFKERADVCAGNTSQCYQNFDELKKRIKNAKT
jgi:predicted MPP superfamily phosphohydrolase